MEKDRIVLIATKGATTDILYEELVKNYTVYLIIEGKISSWNLLWNRYKKIGFINVFGQILFVLFEKAVLQKFASKRIHDLINNVDIDTRKKNVVINWRVSSVNSDECCSKVKEIDPALIILNGTRIISEKSIHSFNKKIINVHTGITPKYRGVHGGYWALVNNDSLNFGTTIHFVNKGIDTGNIIHQEFKEPTSADNFCTYPIFQYTLILSCINKIVDDVIKDSIQSISNSSGESKLYYHPTLWGYLYNRIINKVK